MKAYTVLCLMHLSLLAPFIAAQAQNVEQAAPAVIPRPLEMETGPGKLRLDRGSAIFRSESFRKEADFLAARLRSATGYPFPVKALPEKAPGDAAASAGAILLVSDPEIQLGDEGYTLTVSGVRAEIRASAAAGAFYGVQTLFECLPPEILSDTMAHGVEWLVPEVRIKDRPRFGWRAYLLDEARWFHGMETVKRLLDQLALHKMNVFQWHLTDDQGWRLEIKRYPRLTEVGSRRTDTQAGGWDSEQRAGKPHAGFYTQAQIREIIDYAAERHITIVPEIEMPGHASAAIAAYPEMGTSRQPVEVAITFGKKYDTFNVADDKVYTFLENVLEEVMTLFPSKVIHLGGDEVRFDQWLASPQVKEMMQRLNLSGPAQVQLYFTNRMSNFLESRGRRMMGWNEILGDDLHGFIKEAGGTEVANGSALAENAIIHFWKGSLELAERAATEGHDIVNSYHAGTYLDYTYEDIPLEKAYAFEPVPEGLGAKYLPHVIGTGCQMWGEWIPTRERLDYQSFPRLSAYAEVGWTAAQRKDYRDFLRRMATQAGRWRIQGIGYASEALPK